MNDRLVTVATFHTSAEAHIALNALKDAGVWASLTGENIVSSMWTMANADSGIKLVVREAEAELAIEVIGPLASVGTGEPVVSDEELERQALEGTPEDDEEPPPDTPPASTPAVRADAAAAPPVDREKYAWRAFWLAWFGFACWPLAFVAIYMLLCAAFGTGELSRLGRFRLVMAVVVVLLATIPAALSVGIVWGNLSR